MIFFWDGTPTEGIRERSDSGAYEAGKTAAEMGVNMTAGAVGIAYEAGKTAADMGVNATTGMCMRAALVHRT